MKDCDDKKFRETEIGEELKEVKAWLFRENIRIETARNELEILINKLSEEKEQFRNEKKTLKQSMETERKHLQQEHRFFDQKMRILQSGFAGLEEDRRRFQKEKDKFEARRQVYAEEESFGHSDIAGALFKGVNSFLALKKRYKDLIKMFHPDNVAGDHEMIQIINREFEELKRAYEIGKQA